MRPLVEAADVVHFHSVWCGISTLGTALARRLGKPYTFILNGQLDPWSMTQSRAKKRLAMLAGVRSTLRGAAALQLGNIDEAVGIAPLGLEGPIARIIPNGVFLEEIDPLPPRGAFRARHAAFLGDAPFVLFLSRIHYKKGLDYLGDAFVRIAVDFPDVKLVVVGPEEGAGPAFLDAMQRAGLADRVLMPGPLYGRAKFEALVDAAAFCLPSRQEGFSIAILEALACGVPVVVSENCHFPEIREANAGFSVPLDAGAVADALRQVLLDPVRARAMGEAARRLVAERYTWQIVARQTIELYEEMSARLTTTRRP